MLNLTLALVVSSISHAPDPDPNLPHDPEAPLGPRTYVGLADADQSAAYKVGSMTLAVADDSLRDGQLAVGDSVSVQLVAANKPRAGAPDGAEPPVGRVVGNLDRG